MMWPNQVSLKFCLINAENLFLVFDPPSGLDVNKIDETQWRRLGVSVYENKPLEKCKALARALTEINADIVMLCEVGGPDSLQNFNNLFLGGRYSPVLIEGNSDRNIDIGFLIRKNLPLYYDLFSNKNRPLHFLYPHERDEHTDVTKATRHRFSRDVAELRLFQKNRDEPFLIILLAHLKSRLDRDNIDPNGFERRQAELRTLLEIHGELKAKNPKTPIFMAGDFNGNASVFDTDIEFKELYAKTKLQDVLQLAGKDQESRATFYNIRSGLRAEGRQIDYCFLPPELVQNLNKSSALVYRYKDEFGFDHGVPKSMDVKMSLPSDHYPLVFDLENLQCW